MAKKPTYYSCQLWTPCQNVETFETRHLIDCVEAVDAWNDLYQWEDIPDGVYCTINQYNGAYDGDFKRLYSRLITIRHC